MSNRGENHDDRLTQDDIDRMINTKIALRRRRDELNRDERKLFEEIENRIYTGTFKHSILNIVMCVEDGIVELIVLDDINKFNEE